MNRRAIITCGPGWDPSTHLAGVSIAARAGAEAIAAGATEIWFELDDASLFGPIAEELRRAYPRIPPRLLDSNAPQVGLATESGEETIRLHCGPYILQAARLERFLEGEAAQLLCQDRLVAERAGTGSEDVAGRDVLDLYRPGAARRAILAATTKPSDGLVSRYLNRPISQRISALLLEIPAIRPWHVTIVTAIVALLMFFCFVAGGPVGLIAGGLLFHFASVIDGIDGEMARATFRTSPAGAVMDTAVDMATNLLFYIGITVSLFALYGNTQLLIGGWCILCALIGLMTVRSLSARAGDPGNFDIIKVYYRERYPDGVPAQIVAWLVVITSRDFFAFGNALIIASGWAVAVPALLAVFATIWLGFIALATPAILKRAKGGKVSALDFSAERRPVFRDI